MSERIVLERKARSTGTHVQYGPGTLDGTREITS